MEIKPIKSEGDHRQTLARIEKLMAARPGSAEEDELDILATFVTAYEAKLFPIPDAQATRFELIRRIADRSSFTTASRNCSGR